MFFKSDISRIWSETMLTLDKNLDKNRKNGYFQYKLVIISLPYRCERGRCTDGPACRNNCLPELNLLYNTRW